VLFFEKNKGKRKTRVIVTNGWRDACGEFGRNDDAITRERGLFLGEEKRCLYSSWLEGMWEEVGR